MDKKEIETALKVNITEDEYEYIQRWFDINENIVNLYIYLLNYRSIELQTIKKTIAKSIEILSERATL